MKIAFLMLCHKNPNQINILLDKLLEFDSDIFIHIDKKNYNISSEFMKSKRIHVLNYNECFDINWGGINMIRATLSLINFAKKTNANFDYLWLVSGQDYLINSVKNINKFLIKNKEKNFIHFLQHDANYYKHRKLYTLSYPAWMTKDNIYCKILKRVYMLITGGFKHTFKVFDRSKKYDINVEIGSQWWALKSECAYYILDYCNNNPKYYDFYEKCLIPDESFFQTIISNSKFYNQCFDKLTFVNWKNNKRSPETLTHDDLDLLKKKSKKFFMARKFDIDVDDEILEELNKIIKE
ncbi:MAG: putative N-acetylglucosaminyltransferase [bacterium F083]|nr:MAG: putative N-acetylglucosaminyltransferase [bacterium F083]